jgi:hypothetical protein
MKRLSILFIAVLSLTLLIGCKSEQKKKAEVDPNLIQPEMILRSQDTVQVRRLTKQFLDRLQQKDLDGALAMLRFYEHDSIKLLPPHVYAKERMVYGMFLGMPSYDIDHMIFFREDDSEVKFTVTMFERTDEKDKRPNKASFLIRPVRKGGEWYLTLADTRTDQVKSEIKH